MTNLKLSTTTTRMILMVDENNHVAGLPGLTLTLTLSKDGAAFASITRTVTDRGNGWYAIQLTSGDTDTLGDLVLHAESSGADPADRLFSVVPVNYPANVEQLKGTNIVTPNVAGTMPSDVVSVSGSAATLQNLNIGV
jgi:hypothetical protein